MKQPGNDGRRIELHVGEHAGDFHGMGKIGLAGQPHLTLMDGCGKHVGLLDHLLIRRRQVGLGFIEDVGYTEHMISDNSRVCERFPDNERLLAGRNPKRRRPIRPL